MDTKTAKTEALYILSVIERGSADREFIGEARRKFYDLMNAQGCDRRDYLNSVDACLTLPLPEGYFWLLESKFGSDPHGAILYKAFMKQETQKKYQSDASLPLAMLRAWWTAQPDEPPSPRG